MRDLDEERYSVPLPDLVLSGRVVQDGRRPTGYDFALTGMPNSQLRRLDPRTNMEADANPFGVYSGPLGYRVVGPYLGAITQEVDSYYPGSLPNIWTRRT